MAKVITVTSFESPHCFWIIEKDDEAKRNQLQTLINKQSVKNLQPATTIPETTCIAFHKSLFKRAVLKNVKSNCFLVWLIDFGMSIETTKIFRIPDNLASYATYIKHACLNDVAAATMRVHYEDFTATVEPAESFTPGSIKTAKEHINQAEKIEFICSRRFEDIYCGDVLLYKDQKKYSLTSLLVDMKHITVNHDTFDKALESMLPKSPKELLKQILSDISDPEDETVEGIGIATTRKVLVQNVERGKETDDESDNECNQPILDSEDSKSNILESTSSAAFDTDIEESKTTSDTKEQQSEDIWADLRSKTKRETNFKPPEMYSRLLKKATISVKPVQKQTVSVEAKPTNSNSNENLKFLKGSNNENEPKSSANKADVQCHIDKFICPCDSCSMWRNNDMIGHKLEFVDQSKKERRTIAKPPLLFKTPNEEEESAIKYQQMHSLSKSQRQITPTLLVHGYIIPNPIQAVGKAPFNAKVHQVLRTWKYERPKPVQTYVWSALMRRLNVCVINAPKTGKTMSYIPPLVSFITEKHERYQYLPPESGPIVTIVCSDCNMAENVYSITHDMCSRVSSDIKVCLAIPPLDKRVLNQFEVPCDILVTTPMTLLNLLHNYTINFKRLCHLVLENVDVLLQKLSKEVYILLNVVNNMLEHRNCNYTVQLAFTAESWTTKLEGLLLKLKSIPLMCIGQHLEAALYAKLDIQVHFLPALKKTNIVNDIVSDRGNYYKTLVICNTEQEVSEIERYLVAEGKSMVVFTNKLSMETVREYELVWENHKSDLLYLCTDEFFKLYLNITDAGCLIHYNLPQDSWTTFCRRFKSILDTYTSPFLDNSNKQKGRVHIFVDESCEKQFPRLQHFFTKIGTVLPERFEKCCEMVNAEIEAQKISENVALCSVLKIFGQCDVPFCPQRHYLSENLDKPIDKPLLSGIIHFKVSNIMDVTIFAAHLIEHVDLITGKTEKIKNYCEDIEQELEATCKVTKTYPSTIKVTKWYIWEEKLNVFKRVEVLSVLEVNVVKEPSKVKVELIDHGRIEKIFASQLYELPAKFKAIPKQAVIIHLSNFIPPEIDLKWGSNLKPKIKYLFDRKEYEDEDCFFSSQVLLNLGQNIWVKDIHLKETLHVTDVVVTKLSVKDTIKKRGFGIYTELSLARLYDLCRQFDITLPEYNAKKTVAQEFVQAEPTWAFLEHEEYSKVYFCSAFNPGQFYVRLIKYEDIFQRFQADIQNEIQKPFCRTEFPVEVGKYYLAKDFDGPDFCRVKILALENDVANCFFVDFGDTGSCKKEDLKFLPDDFITKLPFQAIECSLFGISSTSEIWQEESTDILYKYAFEPDANYFRVLYAKLLNQTKVEMRNTYSIILYDNFNKEVININKLIVECGFALCTENGLYDTTINIPETKILDEEIDDADLIQEEFEPVHKYSLFDDQNNFDDLDLVIINEKEFLKELNISKPPQPSVKSIESIPTTNAEIKNTEIQSSLQAPQIEYNETYCNPDILWHQTEQLLKMDIQLPDLTDYTINLLRGNIFHFKVMYNQKEYQVNITLYEKVEKSFQHSTFGQYIRITMKKIKEEMWPRLTVEKRKLRNIRYDIEKHIVPEPESKPFLTLDVEASDDENDLRYEIDSEIDYSESDVESSSDEA